MTALNVSLLLANSPSTSGSYSFSVVRDQVIRQAMLDIGALQEGESPTAQEITDCAFKLNMMVKQWMGNTDFSPGLKIWTRKRAALFLSPTQYTYALGQTGDHWVDSTQGLAYPQLYGQTTLTANAAAGATVLSVAAVSQFNILDYIGIQVGATIFWTSIANIGANTVTIPAPGLPTGGALANVYVWNYTNKAVRPIDVIAVVLRDINVNDVPLRVMTTERYESLPTKAMPSNLGDPTAILYESQYKSQAPNGRLYLDVGGAQDVTKHLHLTYLAPVEDLNNPGDAVDYPQQWYRPLVLGHGRDICGMFDCAWTQELEANYQDALAIAQQTDPARTDVYFEVDGDDPYGGT